MPLSAHPAQPHPGHPPCPLRLQSCCGRPAQPCARVFSCLWSAPRPPARGSALSGWAALGGSLSPASGPGAGGGVCPDTPCGRQRPAPLQGCVLPPAASLLHRLTRVSGSLVADSRLRAFSPWLLQRERGAGGIDERDTSPGCLSHRGREEIHTRNRTYNPGARTNALTAEHWQGSSGASCTKRVSVDVRAEGRETSAMRENHWSAASRTPHTGN